MRRRLPRPRRPGRPGPRLVARSRTVWLVSWLLAVVLLVPAQLDVVPDGGWGLAVRVAAAALVGLGLVAGGVVVADQVRGATGPDTDTEEG